MPRLLPRLGIILFIVYASLFGGVVEQAPLMKVIHQVGGALLIGGWLLHLVWQRRSVPVTRLDWPLWGLVAAWLVAALAGENPRVSLEFVWATFFHISLFFICVDLLQHGHRRTVFEGLFITGGIIVMLSVMEMVLWYWGSPLLAPFWQGWPPLGGYTIPPVIHEIAFPLNHNNPTGAYAVLLIVVAWTWGNTKPRAGVRWGLRILASSLIGVVLLTQSRGAYLGLAALGSFMLLFWLLRPAARARLPRRWRFVLDPRLVWTGAGLAALIAVIILFQIVIYPPRPNPNDVARISLWLSSIQMFEDQMWTGVGPYQFKSAQLYYANWERAYDLILLNHPHNLFFTVLAEGGIIVLAASLWILVRLGRMWWSAWVHAAPYDRRRLEAVLAALLAFGVHNMVDAFIQTQLTIPVLILVSLIAVRDKAARTGFLADERPRLPGKRASTIHFALIGGVLVVSQLAAIPIHRGALAQSGVIAAYQQADYASAWAEIEDAQAVDPWFDLYVLEEAMILGTLAHDQPEKYLSMAIAAFEESVRFNRAWDIGWHNLAALYAQAGDYERAAAAQQTALALNPFGQGYWLKLGEYHESAGDRTAAYAIYIEALDRRPWLAGSGYWTDPEHPARTEFLRDLIRHTEETGYQIELAFYAGDFGLLRSMAVAPSISDYPPAVRERLRVLFPDPTGPPCVYCYYVRDNATFLAIETTLHMGKPTSAQLTVFETDVRRAIFVSEGADHWAWYILARLAGVGGENEDKIDYFLWRAAAIPPDHRLAFTEIYRMQGVLGFLPQARIPRLNVVAYQPWIDLVERELARGKVEDAEAICVLVMKADPFQYTACAALTDR